MHKNKQGNALLLLTRTVDTSEAPKVKPISQQYMGMAYNTMDKDSNVKTLLLFSNINVQMPNTPLAIQQACSLLLSLPRLRS